MQRALARGIGTIMATDAIIDDARMIKIRRQPGDSRMTVVAVISACDVRRVFADRRDAVMAGTASANDVRMVDGEDRCEHIGCVAVLADVGRLYMRRAFSGGIGAVVAVDAIAGDTHVIEIGRQPASR